MPKLIIAIDLDRVPSNSTQPWFSKHPTPKGAPEPLYVYDPEDSNQVKVGDVISFDGGYVRWDPEDNSFLLAEFRGWEE